MNVPFYHLVDMDDPYVIMHSSMEADGTANDKKNHRGAEKPQVLPRQSSMQVRMQVYALYIL